MSNDNNEIVEAIEDGRVVKVSRLYAIREGLLILKRQDLPKALSQDDSQVPYSRYKSEKRFVDLDRYRKPLRANDEITASLVDNFGWVVISKRKERNFSRRQLAEALNVLEDDLKMIELGRLPKNDYVLINKIENYFGIMLRRDSNLGKISSEPRVLKESRFLREQKERAVDDQKSENRNIVGDDIQIIDEVD